MSGINSVEQMTQGHLRNVQQLAVFYTGRNNIYAINIAKVKAFVITEEITINDTPSDTDVIAGIATIRGEPVTLVKLDAWLGNKSLELNEYKLIIYCEFNHKKLGFNSPTISALDTVSDRDFALEILFNISTSMMHISRISEELILWSSYEFQFVRMSDEYATTSSIMPQKKNPDVPELLRGKTGRAYGNMISLFTVMKGLPLAYNKDTQEDKEGVFDSVKTIEISLKILNEVIKTMIVNVDKMENACKIGHLSATDLADYLVQKQAMPFRTAYYITKDVVSKANSLNKDISELTIDEIRTSNDEIKDIDEEIVMYLDLRASMNARTSFGGTSTKNTEEQIKIFEEWLNN